MKKKIIIIIVSCVVVACAGVGITLFVLDSNRQQQEAQHVANITQSIAEWETSFANADSREHRVALHAELADFRDDFVNGNVPLYHRRVRENHRENVISNFDSALTSIENWFYDYYMTAISYIETQANEIMLARQVFIEDTLAEIEYLHTGFLAIVEPIEEVDDEHTDDCDVCQDCENHTDDCEDCCYDCTTDGTITISYIASLQYREFADSKEEFANNNFINDKIEIAENLVVDLENIRLLIANDGVITGSRLQELDNRINALTDELSLQLDDDRVGIVNQFATFVDYTQTWFLDYYENIFTEIAERERTDPYDREAIMQQITDLESLRSLMRSESALNAENRATFTGRINELIERLHEEDHEIWQQFMQQQERQQQQQPRQQQQQQGQQQQTAPPTGGGQQQAPPADGGSGRSRGHGFSQRCECGWSKVVEWWDDEPTPNLESIIVFPCPECGSVDEHGTRQITHRRWTVGVDGGGG